MEKNFSVWVKVIERNGNVTYGYYSFVFRIWLDEEYNQIDVMGWRKK
jgi:hypothetical protein